MDPVAGDESGQQLACHDAGAHAPAAEPGRDVGVTGSGMEGADEWNLVGAGVVLRGPPVGDLRAGKHLAGPGEEPLPLRVHCARPGSEVLAGDDEESLPAAVRRKCLGDLFPDQTMKFSGQGAARRSLGPTAKVRVDR